MTIRINPYLFLITIFFLLQSCSNNPGEALSDVFSLSESAYTGSPPPPTLKSSGLVESAVDDNTVDVIERKLTKIGEIRFETSDVRKTKQLLADAVSKQKGYISSENTSEISGQPENTITIRVPAENFDALIKEIESSASRVNYKNIDVKDVTEEYIDLTARIRTKKEVEERYRQLLNKASKVEEILKIEEQIGNIRTEIESAEGRLRYLSKQVSYSTLTVTYYQKASSQTGFFYKLGESFQSGWNILLKVILIIVNLWAIILFFGIVWMLIYWFAKRNKQKKQPPLR